MWNVLKTFGTRFFKFKIKAIFSIKPAGRSFFKASTRPSSYLLSLKVLGLGHQIRTTRLAPNRNQKGGSSQRNQRFH
jgi:hypothetical protein